MADKAAVCKKHKNTLAPDFIFKIHPAIGIARVGNSPSDFFIGPEIPGKGATGAADGVGSAVPPYKAGGMIKRQAARFRIWKYKWNSKKCQYIPMFEINLDSPGVKKITWKVHLANRKAAFFAFDGTNGERPPYGWNVKFLNRSRNAYVTGAAARAAKLEIDPGEKSIEGASKSGVTFDKVTAGIPSFLGELRTDAKGRLLVLGGRGKSESSPSLVADHAAALGIPPPLPPSLPISNYANNDTWLDDVSDGPVSAEIELVKGKKISWEEIVGSWVLVGPPDFAPPLENLVTLYDTVADVAVQHGKQKETLVPGTLTIPQDNALYTEYAPDKGLQRLAWLNAEFAAGTGLDKYKASFRQEIYPIVQRVLNYAWTHKKVQGQHVVFPYPSIFTQAIRNVFLGFTRVPEGMTRPSDPALAAFSPMMPKLLGDEELDRSGGPVANRRPDAHPGNAKEFLALTSLQYALVVQWWKGTFEKDGWPASNNPADLPPPAATETPEGLDRAALENCVGGAFFPGIEVCWLIRNPKIYSEPFRIDPWERDAAGAIKKVAGKPVPTKIEYGRPGDAGSTELEMTAGFFSQQMALPWQADFSACTLEEHPSGSGVEFGWWPAQRPDWVKFKSGATWTLGLWDRGVGSMEDMVTKWHTRGFVVKSGAEYVEDGGPP